MTKWQSKIWVLHIRMSQNLESIRCYNSFSQQMDSTGAVIHHTLFVHLLASVDFVEVKKLHCDTQRGIRGPIFHAQPKSPPTKCEPPVKSFLGGLNQWVTVTQATIIQTVNAVQLLKKEQPLFTFTFLYTLKSACALNSRAHLNDMSLEGGMFLRVLAFLSTVIWWTHSGKEGQTRGTLFSVV